MVSRAGAPLGVVERGGQAVAALTAGGLETWLALPMTVGLHLRRVWVHLGGASGRRTSSGAGRVVPDGLCEPRRRRARWPTALCRAGLPRSAGEQSGGAGHRRAPRLAALVAALDDRKAGRVPGANGRRPDDRGAVSKTPVPDQDRAAAGDRRGRRGLVANLNRVALASSPCGDHTRTMIRTPETVSCAHPFVRSP